MREVPAGLPGGLTVQTDDRIRQTIESLKGAWEMGNLDYAYEYARQVMDECYDRRVQEGNRARVIAQEIALILHNTPNTPEG